MNDMWLVLDRRGGWEYEQTHTRDVIRWGPGRFTEQSNARGFVEDELRINKVTVGTRSMKRVKGRIMRRCYCPKSKSVCATYDSRG